MVNNSFINQSKNDDERVRGGGGVESACVQLDDGGEN